MKVANIANQIGVLFERFARLQQILVVSSVDVQHDNSDGNKFFA